MFQAVLIALSCLGQAAAPEDPDAPVSAPRDLIAIAEREAARAYQEQRFAVLQKLRLLAVQREGSPAFEQGFQQLVDLGPDQVSILEDFLQGIGDSTQEVRQGELAVRALLQLHCRANPASTVGSNAELKDPSILFHLRDLLHGGSAGTRKAILAGIGHLDDPHVVQMVRGFLESDDPETVQLALKAMSLQSSPAACAAVEALLGSERVPQAQVLAALEPFANPESTAKVTALLETVTQREFVEAALEYLRDLGTGTALGPLQKILNDPKRVLGGTSAVLWIPLQEKCLEVIREIGLRGDAKAHGAAEEILVSLWRHSPSARLRSTAAWNLGPFENKEAFAERERDFQIEMRDRDRKEPGPYVAFAEVQLQFRRYDDALRTLSRAEQLDERGALAFRIGCLRAVAYCGKKDFGRAARVLEGLQGDLSSLPRDYREVRAMAELEEYRDLFASR